jgi:hypothetical protein
MFVSLLPPAGLIAWGAASANPRSNEVRVTAPPTTPSAAPTTATAQGSTPTDYAQTICDAVGPFEKDVAARSRALDLTTIKSASDGKTALQGFLAAIAADTTKAVVQLKAAGTPNVTNGDKIAAAIVSAFSQLGKTLAAAATQAQTLPTNSPADFRTAASSLGTNVRNSMGSIGQSLGALKSPELEAAAKAVPACQALG